MMTVTVRSAIICLSIVLLAGLVYFIGSTYSRRSFRRHLQSFFQKHPWSFTENMALTKEIGLFLGIRHGSEMTVEEFVHSVKKALGVPAQDVSHGTNGDRSRRMRDLAPPVTGRP